MTFFLKTEFSVCILIQMHLKFSCLIDINYMSQYAFHHMNGLILKTLIFFGMRRKKCEISISVQKSLIAFLFSSVVNIKS